MKLRFRLYRRRQGGRFYAQDSVTGKQESLGTVDRSEALRLLHARNEATHHPGLNLQIARAYLAADDPATAQRTWLTVMETMAQTKTPGTSSRARWERAIKDPAYALLRTLPLVQTKPEHLLRVMEAGTISTNMFLRRLQNFAIDMTWLPWPVLTKRQWPPIHHRERRSITLAEHRALVARETNLELKAFYELAWHIGGAQTDLAGLKAENIDWEHRLISFNRMKTGSLAVLRFGEELAVVLRQLPKTGHLFPKWSRISASDRAARFGWRCRRLGIVGVSLHSYRYAWAERAKIAGYPERFAQEALGHKSQAVHRAYARKARVELPSLEEYEKQRAEPRVTAPPTRNSATEQAATTSPGGNMGRLPESAGGIGTT